MPTPDDKVTVVDEHGNATDVAPEEVSAYQARGFSPESGDARADRIGSAARTEAEGTAAPIALGILRGATFGGSDALIRAFGGQQQAQQIAEDHPGASLLGNIGGALLTGGATAGKLGEAVGGGILGHVAEGAAYGAGQGVSELSLSSDPITLEHAASVLSSNMLYGGAIGGAAGTLNKLAEKGLVAVRGALAEAAERGIGSDSVAASADLAGMDAKALRAQAVAAKAENVTAIKAETDSLEQLRVEQRTEVANQVKDLHAQLADETPIFKAVQGADVEAIDGVKDIRVQLAKSFKTMRAQFDDPIGVQKDPRVLLKPLRMQQTALEGLQSKMPELQATLGADARAAALEHVDEALARNKAFQTKIADLAPANPVKSARLAELQAGSPRMAAIADAQDALQTGGEKSFGQTATQGVAFGGGMAVGHLVPGIGHVVGPHLGAKASSLVGKLFSGKLLPAIRESAAGTAKAVSSFLETAQKGPSVVPVIATKVLGKLRYANTQEPAPEEKQSLAQLYKARTDEIKSQTMYDQTGTPVMRPEARQAMAKRLDPIRMADSVAADKIETIAARRLSFLSSKIPRRPDLEQIQTGPDRWQPSDMAMRTFARYAAAAEDPTAIEHRVAAGTVTPEDAEAYHAIYPERAEDFKQQILMQLPKLQKQLPYIKRLSLSIFSGVPVDPAMNPNVLTVLQGGFAAEPGSQGGTSAPTASPQFGSVKKSVESQATPSQKRAGG